MLAGTINRKQGKFTWCGTMPDLQQEIALIHRIANKDEDALREIYAVYGQRLYAYALRLTSDHVQRALLIIRPPNAPSYLARHPYDSPFPQSLIMLLKKFHSIIG